MKVTTVTNDSALQETYRVMIGTDEVEVRIEAGESEGQTLDTVINAAVEQARQLGLDVRNLAGVTDLGNGQIQYQNQVFVLRGDGSQQATFDPNYRVSPDDRPVVAQPQSNG